MEININENTRLSEIHAQFQDRYPFLDLAFFAEQHQPGEASSRASRLPLNLMVGEAGNGHGIGSLDIEDGMTVGELETILETRFGLHTQVLKKSGDLWLQSTLSDGVSLKELNRQTREFNSIEPLEASEEDYHEQE